MIPPTMPWPLWRVVAFEKVAGLHEVETYWNIVDLIEANEALDVKDELEAEAAERAKPKKGK